MFCLSQVALVGGRSGRVTLWFSCHLPSKQTVALISSGWHPEESKFASESVRIALS